uniref:Uncharacterized protein n=1 Tax=Heterorhabditis bacteriophora TaxID=37862 RepID=A0A1I7WQA3_HETBA
MRVNILVLVSDDFNPEEKINCGIKHSYAYCTSQYRKQATPSLLNKYGDVHLRAGGNYLGYRRRQMGRIPVILSEFRKQVFAFVGLRRGSILIEKYTSTVYRNPLAVRSNGAGKSPLIGVETRICISSASPDPSTNV